VSYLPPQPGNSPTTHYLQPPQPKNSNLPLIIGASVLGGLLVIGLCVGLVLIGSSAPDKDAVVAPPASRGVTVAPQVAATTRATEPTEEAIAPTAEPTNALAVPAKIVMPKVTGKNAAVAEDELKAAGFTKIQFGSADEEDTFVILPQNWTVTKQSAKAGSKVAPDRLIVLTCTKKA